MSDNYDFEKSSRPQDVHGYSPYMDKQYYGFINDSNGGVIQILLYLLFNLI